MRAKIGDDVVVLYGGKEISGTVIGCGGKCQGYVAICVAIEMDLGRSRLNPGFFLNTKYLQKYYFWMKNIADFYGKSYIWAYEENIIEMTPCDNSPQYE